MLGTEYAHPMLAHHGERRNSSGQSSLGQALGSQLTQNACANVQPYPSESYRQTPTSPPSMQASTDSQHSSAATSPVLKRKNGDGFVNTTTGTPSKRRRDTEDGSEYEDGSGQGSKHWTDEEKSRLFNWLMAVGQDEHWQSLRATKNSCLRECASNVYEGKKSYQALKGCYERNFNLFKQLYAFEMFNEQSRLQRVSLQDIPDDDTRQQEYERRLQLARNAGVDVKGISPRILDHWQNRTNWYDLFYSRWHGDPATTRPTAHRNAANAHVDPDDDHDPPLDYDATNMGMNHLQHPIHSALNQPPQFIHHIEDAGRMSLSDAPHLSNVQSTSSQDPMAFLPPSSSSHHQIHTPGPMPRHAISPPIHSSPLPHDDHPLENPMVALSLTQSMYGQFVQYMQAQSHYYQTKLDYLRRREEREMIESQERREYERVRHNQEMEEYDRRKHLDYLAQRRDWAYQAINTPLLDPGVKQRAVDFLKSLFSAQDFL